MQMMIAPRKFALPAGYAVHVDTVDKERWHDALDHFADANIYQSWSYESERAGPGSTSHLLLTRDSELVAAAQLRIVKLPLVNVGVAYVRWGPMWRPWGRPADSEVLATTLRCIRCEYATGRGLSVRVLPYLFEDERDSYQSLLAAGHFARLGAEVPQRTLIMSLECSLPELRAKLDQKWRNCLNRAERNGGLVIEEGTDDGLFERFTAIHAEMRARKSFAATSDVNEFRTIQRNLPERHKMRLFLASTGGELAAGVVCSRIGDFGVFLHGATSDGGMHTSASHLLQWRAVGWLKDSGATSYNLHGINPATNPGTYRFKAGLCGRAGRDLHYLGSYESSDATPSRMVVNMASSLRRAYRNGRRAIRQLSPATGR